LLRARSQWRKQAARQRAANRLEAVETQQRRAMPPDQRVRAHPHRPTRTPKLRIKPGKPEMQPAVRALATTRKTATSLIRGPRRPGTRERPTIRTTQAKAIPVRRPARTTAQRVIRIRIRRPPRPTLTAVIHP